MKCSVRGPRSRWVGPPVSAPKSKLGRSPRGRQRHYGAVELAGAGDQVIVNDVVEVAENEQQQETSQRHPVLVQVLSLWEDTFTGVFMFRARWLVQASNLPADALPRLRTTRQASATDGSATGSETLLGQDHDGADEVFLTNSVKDLEVRSIVKPITLCVSTSTTTEVSPARKDKMGPRLTHAYCDASGEFHRLENTDPILKRARVRLANAVALASRADQEHEAAKSGKPIVKSNGWLLPKRGAFQRRGERTAACGAEDVVEIVPPSSTSTGSHASSSLHRGDIENASDDCGSDEPPSSEDGQREQGEEDKEEDATDTHSDSPRDSTPRDSTPTLSGGEGFTQRKSTRKRKSQRSPTPDAKVEHYSAIKPEAKFCPSAATSAPTFQTRHRVPFKTRQGPLHPRPRRLAMPPMAEQPAASRVCEPPPDASAKLSVAVKVVRPVRTRISLGLRPKSPLDLPRSSSVEDASAQLSITVKKKRSVANKTTQGANRSDNPPLRTLVGKDYQTDIPDLLSADERNRPHTGTGAKMVWRSIQDWDPQSRGMLATYLHAAKGVVEAKQARPGVAVHVRLGGKKRSSGVGKDESTDIASSYAVWALSSGREARGLMRVGCSEIAQTDIPRSAIQRVQSQEQALSALVKARCVLDNFEPALKMLAGGQGSPESIEPWTLQQVRTLEKALVKEYDPNRRLHGWARPGMEMDHEDFIDLAKVSKEVPGKTPAQVLSFYYRYLAAAEPLTDVVYGPEAAMSRKLEPISRVSSAHEADGILPINGQHTRGNANTTNLKLPARQVPSGRSKVSAASSSGTAIESAPIPKPRVIRLSAPKPVKLGVAISEPHVGPTIDSVQNCGVPTKQVLSPPACDAVYSAPGDTSTSHAPAISKHATNDATSGGDEPHAHADRVTGRELAGTNRLRGRSVDGQGGGDGGRDSASKYLAQQRRGAMRERKVRKTRPALPSDAEVLEVEDSDDADGGGASRNPAVSSPGGGEPVRPSDVEAAAQYITTMGPAGLSWVARQIRRQAAPPVAPEHRPSGALPNAPRSAPCNSDRKGGHRAGGSDDQGHGYRSEAPSLPVAQREPRWEQPPLSPPRRHEEQMGRLHDRPSSGQVQRGDNPSGRVSSTGYPDRRNVDVTSEPASIDETFGAMAPCWRLLERAQDYMDKDQLKYMKGLILTHVSKPMSRDQLLERAESCLQEQDRIFAAFVKMFDHIDQPPQVPLYPTKRALHRRPQWTSYSVGRSPDTDPNHASPHVLPATHIPSPFAFKAPVGDSYSMRPVDDGGESRIPKSTPSQQYPRAGIPVSGFAETERSIHPYDHNGAGGWRASAVGSTVRDDYVGIRAEPSPHRLSPGPQPSDVRLHPAGNAERLTDAGHDGGGRVRNAWSQQPAGEWESEAGSSAAKAAATPLSMIRRDRRGPAWGDGGQGAWS